MGPLVCDACHTVTFTDVPFVSITWTSWFTGAKGAVSRTEDNTENRRLFITQPFTQGNRKFDRLLWCYSNAILLHWFYSVWKDSEDNYLL